MEPLLQFILLPKELSDFERNYLRRINRTAFFFLVAHLPILTLLATFNHTRPLLALTLSAAVLAGPLVAWRTLENPRHVSLVISVAGMFLAGLLVHFGQGPVQIEMHFYFFCLLAMCAAFGNPLVIIAAALTVILHHLVVWLVLPASVFNYQASSWVVLIHATFVVVDGAATCFIARTFFDNVIGLERVIGERTERLNQANRGMRLLLDNVEQGFLTISREAALAPERSAVVDRWLGFAAPSTSWFDYLARVDPTFAQSSRLHWSEVTEGVMPLAVTLAQMPSHLEIGSEHYRVEYRPIGAGEAPEAFLVILTCVTSQVERERAELERREGMVVFERLMSDRAGIEALLDEGGQVLAALEQKPAADLGLLRRLLHTLKGNAAALGLTSVSDLAHQLEEDLAEDGRPSPSHRSELAKHWSRLSRDVQRLLAQREQTIPLDERQATALETAVRTGESREALLQRVQQLRLEPTERRLRHFATQAQRIAERLEKVPLEVRVEDNGIRLDAAQWAPVWNVLIHSVRNALDHGIEPPAERQSRGKLPGGLLTLRTEDKDGRFVIEVRDDGRGVDWETVRRRAQQAGLPSADANDLRRALFQHGISTSDGVSELSGRGVGLSALQHAAQAQGGAVELESVPGEGTAVRMVFPSLSLTFGRAGGTRTERAEESPFSALSSWR